MGVTVGHEPGTEPAQVVRSLLLDSWLPTVFKALAWTPNGQSWKSFPHTHRTQSGHKSSKQALPMRMGLRKVHIWAHCKFMLMPMQVGCSVGFWEQESMAMCGHKSPGMASSHTGTSPSHSQRLQGLVLLGLALPGASQGPLESWRQALSTCWRPLDSWYCGKHGP